MSPPLKVLLVGIRSLQHINSATQLSIFSKLADPTVNVTDKCATSNTDP